MQVGETAEEIETAKEAAAIKAQEAASTRLRHSSSSSVVISLRSGSNRNKCHLQAERSRCPSNHLCSRAIHLVVLSTLIVVKVRTKVGVVWAQRAAETLSNIKRHREILLK